MRAITGIQPTNSLHIGNLFGAVLPAMQMQKDYDLSVMIVDLHAITVPQDPTALRKNILFLAAAYIAAGIDPAKTALFQQSQIPAHAELAWLLQTVGRMGELERMTQFKDKAGLVKNVEELRLQGEQDLYDIVVKKMEIDPAKVRSESSLEDLRRQCKIAACELIEKFHNSQIEKTSVGLFTYPVLMAADILLYDIDAVPVGEDQKQHVELTRDLAERFNRDFGETFVVPKPVIRKEGARILGLDNPEKKMSKSAASAKNYISLTDDADTITKKIRAAVTDSLPGITLDDARPGLKNLITIFSLATGESMESIAARFADKGMKDLKDATAEALIAYLMPIQKKMNDLLSNEAALIEIINAGSAKAALQATKKVQAVKARMGLVL